MGHRPVLAPLLTVRPVMHRILPPDGFAATVLTSANAVAACAPACHTRPAFAVGSATAERARAAGFREVIDANADAAALPDLIVATIGAPGRPAVGEGGRATGSRRAAASQSLLLPVGRLQGMALAAALRAKSYRVSRRVAYHAVAVGVLPQAAHDALKAQELTVALFFSTETAKIFVRLVQAAGLAEAVSGVTAVAISERAAAPLTSLPWQRIAVAARPNQDAMLVLVR